MTITTAADRTLPRLHRGAPLYQQAMHLIAEAIRDGRYPAGTALPSEAQLCAALGISRPTVRQAIAGLRTKGIVTVHMGKGAFVAPDWDATRCPTCGACTEAGRESAARLAVDLAAVAAQHEAGPFISTGELMRALIAHNYPRYRDMYGRHLTAAIRDHFGISAQMFRRATSHGAVCLRGYRCAELAALDTPYHDIGESS
jgi:DNA-binding transcriptional regulator YhcF (GntR family)